MLLPLPWCWPLQKNPRRQLCVADAMKKLCSVSKNWRDELGSAAFTTRKSEPVRLPRHQLQRNHWLLVTRVGGRVSAQEAGGGRGGQLVPLLEAEAAVASSHFGKLFSCFLRL